MHQEDPKGILDTSLNNINISSSVVIQKSQVNLSENIGDGEHADDTKKQASDKFNQNFKLITSNLNAVKQGSGLGGKKFQPKSRQNSVSQGTTIVANTLSNAKEPRPNDVPQVVYNNFDTSNLQFLNISQGNSPVKSKKQMPPKPGHTNRVLNQNKSPAFKDRKGWNNKTKSQVSAQKTQQNSMVSPRYQNPMIQQDPGWNQFKIRVDKGQTTLTKPQLPDSTGSPIKTLQESSSVPKLNMDFLRKSEPSLKIGFQKSQSVLQQKPFGLKNQQIDDTRNEYTPVYQNLPENKKAQRESLITIGQISSGEKQQQNELESQADNIQDFINFISARGNVNQASTAVKQSRSTNGSKLDLHPQSSDVSIYKSFDNSISPKKFRDPGSAIKFKGDKSHSSKDLMGINSAINLSKGYPSGSSSILQPHRSQVLTPLLGDKICLEHGKARALICVNCQTNVCDTCALFGSHKGHDVRQKCEVSSDIELRLELLMETYQSLQNEFENLEEQTELFKKYEILTNRKRLLKTQAQQQVDKWKQMLEDINAKICNKIDDHFQPYEELFEVERANITEVREEGNHQQEIISQILNNYTATIEQDQTHIAFELLNNDPLNENSCEYLCTQSEIWLDRTRQALNCVTLEDLPPKYDKIKISFAQDFSQRVDSLYQVFDKDKQAKEFQLSLSQHKNHAKRDLNQTGARAVRPPSRSFKEMRDLRSGMNQSHNAFNSRKGSGLGLRGQGQSPTQINDGPPLGEVEVNNSLIKRQIQNTRNGSPPNFKNEVKINESHTADRRLMDRRQEQASFRASKLDFSQLEKGLADLKEGSSERLKQVSSARRNQKIPENIHSAQQSARSQSFNTNLIKTQQFNKASKTINHEEEEEKVQQIALMKKRESQHQPLTKTIGGAQQVARPGQGSPQKKKLSLQEFFKQQLQNASGGSKSGETDGQINLSKRNLTDLHINQLCQLLKKYGGNGSLKYLDLSNNRITDEGAVHLMKASCETHLFSLTLYKNLLTDKCAEPIVQALKSSKNLRLLDLSNNKITSRVAKNKLKNGLSGKKIDILL